MSELIRHITTRGVTHAPDKPVLELRNVSVSYGNNGGRQLALQDVSCQIESGERIAVVGPNGAGKSTLFKLIVGTIKPQQGEVHISGEEPGDHICIAYVPQRSQIDLTFPVTVEDVVMMGRVGQIGFFHWPRRRDWDFVREALGRVNAGHLAKKQIGELSGGQQQRVFIARALAQQAEILLLDEPLTGLDVPSQDAIFTILDNLRPDGVTVLVATHDLNLAAQRFDRVMLLNRRIVSFGSAETSLAPNKLVAAYGGQMHIVEGSQMILTDTCCDPE